jgi:hypothetical protein
LACLRKGEASQILKSVKILASFEGAIEAEPRGELPLAETDVEEF